MGKSITALIPVRKGSKRVKNKNTKPFSDTNLLEHKIRILQQVKGINEILVTSDCSVALSIAKKMGVSYTLRDSYYASDECPGSENLQYIAGQTNTDHVLYSPVTSPFVTIDTYNDIIKLYNDTDEFDSIVSINYLKKFLWEENKPLNYDPYDCPKSQDMKSIFGLTFGVCLLPRQTMIDKRYIVGDNPYWYELNDRESIDVDIPFDFDVAEMIYENDIIQKNKNNDVMVLDCTVRDGGFVNNHQFEMDDVKRSLKASSDIGYEYFEIGYITDEKYIDERHGVWKNIPFDLIDSIVDEVKPECKISVMMDSWRYNIEDLPEKGNHVVDLIRVCAYQEQIDQALEQCKIIKQKGYKASLNVICISHIDMEYYYDLRHKLLNNDFLDFLCFADSYGAATPDLVRKIITLFRNISPTIKLGFHCHDNISLAMATTIAAIESGADIVDGSYKGMGRGGGNLKIELITMYLNLHGKSNFNLTPLLRYLNDNIDDREFAQLKQSICGVFNIHPYRLKAIKDKDLEVVYKKLMALPEEAKKRIEYKLK